MQFLLLTCKPDDSSRLPYLEYQMDHSQSWVFTQRRSE